IAVDPRYVELASARLPALQANPNSRLLDAGKAPGPGFILKQPELARTLEAIARLGHAGFYSGPTARTLVEAVNAAGGLWSLADLENYRVIERVPLRINYRGARVTTVPPPSSGGLVLAESLGILSHLPAAQNSQRVHYVVEALRRGYQDRAIYMGDPAFTRIPADELRSEAYARQRAASIDARRATPSEPLAAPPDAVDGDNTTHFSIIDRHGNRVAATLSINTPFGSGFVAGTSGVLLNNEMDDFSIAPGLPNSDGLVGGGANAIEPGKRPLSSMSPAFVEDRRGVLILGTPGGSRIISMLLLAILGYLDQVQPDAQRVVDGARFHHQFLPDRLEVEPPGFAPELLRELEAMGHRVHVAQRSWGNMQAVYFDYQTLQASAASDRRAQQRPWPAPAHNPNAGRPASCIMAFC
ncbi:MAG: gamma-glutamyltransferase family protein, partial [Burkholderiales bacterium]